MKTILLISLVALSLSLLPRGSSTVAPADLNCTSCQADSNCLFCEAVSGVASGAQCLCGGTSGPSSSDCTALGLEAAFFCQPEVTEEALDCDACASAGCTYCNPFAGISSFVGAPPSEAKCFCGAGTNFICATKDPFLLNVQACTELLGCYECKEQGCEFCAGSDFFGLQYPDRCDCNAIPFCIPILSEQTAYCDFFMDVGVYLIPGLGVPLLAMGGFFYFRYNKRKLLVAQTLPGDDHGAVVNAVPVHYKEANNI